MAKPNALDLYAQPLPLVVEVWSPSTDTYDVDEKIPQYKARGDREIWRIHPYEQTFTIWQRQPDGTYVESFHKNETVSPAFLPNVAIDLAALFVYGWFGIRQYRLSASTTLGDAG